MKEKFYRLVNTKFMGDSSNISERVLLKKISKQKEEKFMVETVDEMEKKIFWVSNDEVKVIKK